MSDATNNPTSFGPARAPTRPRRGRWIMGGGALVAVAVLIAVAVSATASSTSSSYRTATVSTQTVDQVLHSVGTIEPVRQATVAFPVAGTVSSLGVAVGDDVTTGQTLAALDTTALRATATTKQAALDKANANLQKALNGQNPGLGSGSSGAGGAGSAVGTAYEPNANGNAVVTPIAFATTSADPSPGGGSGGSSGSGGAAGSGNSTSTSGDLATAQQKVLSAQKQVDADLAAAQQALADAQAPCAAISSGADPTSPGVPATSPSGSVASCQAALQDVLTAQRKVSADQAALADASTALDQLLTAQAANGGANGSGGSGTAGNRAAGGSSAGSGSGTGTAGGGSRSSGSGSSASSAPTASELVAYQKVVDAAQADLAVAQQAVAQATIVSPIDGTIAAVDLTVGTTVAAGSATANIVVVGQGGFEVTTHVAVTNLSDVKVGQSADVVPDGQRNTVTGKVVSIGIAGTASGSSTTYPVVIGLTGNRSGLDNGGTASVGIVTDASARALAVPTSAVTSEGGRHRVTVVHGGTASVVSVEVGAMGDTWTAITSGLHEGQKVALADVNQPLPGSATSSSNGTTNTGSFSPRIRFGGFQPGGG